MKVVFMGTPDFALPSLRKLAESGHEIEAVLTQEDRPKGRKLVLTPPPVKSLALRLGLKVLQPPRPSDPAFLKEMRRLNPDLITVVAYGRYLPPELWDLPRHKTINLHPSLLPRYRGASPIQAAILNGDRETGATILYLSDEMDAGDIIKQQRVPITEDDTCATLSVKLADMGAKLLLEAVNDIERGTVERRPQDGPRATVTRKIKKEDGLIDWSKPAREIWLKVKAYNPWPSAYTLMEWHGRRAILKILEADVEEECDEKAGMVARAGPEGIAIGTGKGILVAKVIQHEGKRPMSASEFIAGHRELEGAVLG